MTTSNARNSATRTMIEQMNDLNLSAMNQIGDALEAQSGNEAICALSGIADKLEACLALYRAAIVLHRNER